MEKKKQREEAVLAGWPVGDDQAATNHYCKFPWLTELGFIFLTFNSGMAIYRSNGDVAAVAFVGTSYADLVLPFICLRLFEKSHSDSSARGTFKAAVWVLTTLLAVVFSYKVAAIMPVELVWAVTGVTVLGGFYAFSSSFEKGGPSSPARDNQQREALLDHRPAGEDIAQAVMYGDVGFSWLTLLGFAFLTFNSGMAIYQSDGDVATVAFVAASYVDVVLPFVRLRLRLFKKSQPDSPARGNFKAVVWVLTTILTIVSSYKVAATMPVSVQALVWAMAGATVVGGFYAFFVHTESKVAAIMPVPVQVLVWAMASATVYGGFYVFFVHKESMVMAIMPMADKVVVWGMAGATVLGGFDAFLLHRESKEGKACRKDKARQNFGVMAIVFGSVVLLNLLVAPPSMEGANGVRFTTSLLLALTTFLCGSTLTLLTLPGHRLFGSRHDALLDRLALGCVTLYTLASLALLWPFPRNPYPYVVIAATAVAAALIGMLLVVVAPVQRSQPRHSGNEAPAAYDQAKVDLGKASKIIAAVAVVAAGCLIVAVPELSGTAPAASKTAAFFLLCTAVLSLFLTVLSKMAASAVERASTVRHAEGPRPPSGKMV